MKSSGVEWAGATPSETWGWEWLSEFVRRELANWEEWKWDILGGSSEEM